MVQKCLSCNSAVTSAGSAIFLCPQCQNEKIARCDKCKRNDVSYKCPACEFEGP